MELKNKLHNRTYDKYKKHLQNLVNFGSLSKFMMNKYLKHFINREHVKSLEENKEIDYILSLDIKHFYPYHNTRLYDIKGVKTVKYIDTDSVKCCNGGLHEINKRPYSMVEAIVDNLIDVEEWEKNVR